MTDKARLEVTAGFVVRNGLVLLARRRPGDTRGGLWEFPGGRREPGESLRECLARELLEELGVEVEVGEELLQVSHVYPDCEITLHLFTCRLMRGEPRPLGCAEVRWVKPTELGDLDLAPADRVLARRLAEAGKLPLGES